MKGSIRALVGFLIVFGAMGTLEVDATANAAVQALIGLVGCAIMYNGVSKMVK